MASGDAVTDVLDLSGNGKGVALNVYPGSGCGFLSPYLGTFEYDDGTLYYTDEVGVRHLVTFDSDAGFLMRRVLCRWNERAGIGRYRFPSMTAIDDNTRIMVYSAGSTASAGSEIGMRLECRKFHPNIATQNPFLYDPVVIDTPPFFGSNAGAIWPSQIIRLPNGTLICYVQYLISDDGTYAHASARYSFGFYWSLTGNAGEWSAYEEILAGEDAGTAFNWTSTDFTGGGWHIPGGPNVVVQMESGRIVMVGYLPVSPYAISCIYTDGNPLDPASYQFGNPTAYPSNSYNEPSIGFARDGSLIFAVRNEAADTRLLYTSINEGEDIVLLRDATDIPIINTPNAIYGDEHRLLIAGATNPTRITRNQVKLYRSFDDAMSVSEGGQLLEPLQQGGYGSLQMFVPGYIEYLFEGANHQTQYNFTDNINYAAFNLPYANGQPLPSVEQDSENYIAATEYALYAAYVAEQGGTIDDPVDCQAAFTWAIAHNLYSAMLNGGLAWSPKWGYKIGGPSVVVEIYSLNRTKSLPIEATFGATINTALESFNVLDQAPGNIIEFPITPRAGASIGVIIASGDHTGLVSWTDDTAAHNFNNLAGCSFTVGGVTYLIGNPIYNKSAGDTSFYFVDPQSNEVAHGLNGEWKQDITGFDWKTAIGETETIQFTSFEQLHEFWLLNNTSRCGREGTRQGAKGARTRTT